MNILVVGNRIPWPLHDGGALATYRMLESLSLAGNTVTYFSYNTKKHHVPKSSIEENISFCEVIPFDLNAEIRPWDAFKNLFSKGSYFLERYFNEEASVYLSALIEERNFDLIQIEGLYSFPIFANSISFWGEIYTSSLKDLQNKGLPLVYRAHNVEHEIWSRLAQNESNWLKRAYLRIQSKRLKKEEESLIESVDAVVGISQNDCAFFEKFKTPRVHMFLPSVKTPLKVDIKIQPESIFHIGSMEWDANVQGIQWFLSKVWPKVKSAHPNLSFHVAGKGISKHENLFFQTGVHNHGEVPNAQEFMRNYGISIIPLLAGSGIRMKIIEAMSLGVPCVATDIAVQGLPISKQDDCIAIANDAEQFAEALNDLLNNRKKAIQMAKNAHQYCLKQHSAVKNMEALLSFYNQLTR